MGVIQEKKALRKLIKARKTSFSTKKNKELSSRIFDEIEQLEVFKRAKIVMLYWSLPDEVYTHEFILNWYKKKTFLLPVIVGDIIRVKQFLGPDKMIHGEQYAIPEPAGSDFTDLSQIELVIVPGIAFDRNNNRLGRGKAFYDKFLPLTHAWKLGVCFDFQRTDRVPVEKEDVSMDQVISC